MFACNFIPSFYSTASFFTKNFSVVIRFDDPKCIYVFVFNLRPFFRLSRNLQMRYRREGNEKAPARSARPVTPQKDESSDESDSGTSDELSEKKSNIDDLDNEARKSIETSGNEAEGPKVVLHIIDQNAISNAVKRAPKRGHAKVKILILNKNILKTKRWISFFFIS